MCARVCLPFIFAGRSENGGLYAVDIFSAHLAGKGRKNVFSVTAAEFAVPWSIIKISAVVLFVPISSSHPGGTGRIKFLCGLFPSFGPFPSLTATEGCALQNARRDVDCPMKSKNIDSKRLMAKSETEIDLIAPSSLRRAGACSHFRVRTALLPLYVIYLCGIGKHCSPFRRPPAGGRREFSMLVPPPTPHAKLFN